MQTEGNTPGDTTQTGGTPTTDGGSVSGYATNAGIPLGLPLAVLAAVAVLFFLVLCYCFPIFVIADELLVQFPPEGVAKVREVAFSRCRLTNSLLAIGSASFVTAIFLPGALVVFGHAPRRALATLIPTAVLSAAVAWAGVFLGHLAMEALRDDVGISRTMMAHTALFGFFGAGTGLAIGIAIRSLKFTVEGTLRGAITGCIAAVTFDLMSIALPKFQIDWIIPGGVLWGSRDPLLIMMFAGLLIPPLAFGLRSLGITTTRSKARSPAT